MGGVEGWSCVTEVGVVSGRRISREKLADRTRSIEVSPALRGLSNGSGLVVGGSSNSFVRVENSVTLVSIKISLVVDSTTSGLAVSYLACP